MLCRKRIRGLEQVEIPAIVTNAASLRRQAVRIRGIAVWIAARDMARGEQRGQNVHNTHLSPVSAMPSRTMRARVMSAKYSGTVLRAPLNQMRVRRGCIATVRFTARSSIHPAVASEGKTPRLPECAGGVRACEGPASGQYSRAPHNGNSKNT